jgi:GNAT superfamily N-acetyltransferase
MAADPDLIALFARGWAMTRVLEPPLPRHGGHYIHVGQPDQKARYIFADLEPTVIGELVGTIAEPWIYLKICEWPEAVSAVLPPQWLIRTPPTWMMTKSLEEADFALPRGYNLRIEKDGAILRSTIDFVGESVARGRIALLERHVLFDQIGTDEAHRRKGLARALMQSLSNAALQHGASHGLLSATEMGRWLYTTIGWDVHSPYTSAVIPG